MEKRELVALLSLSSWCLVMVMWLLFDVPWVNLRFVIVVFPDHTYLLFMFLMLINPIASKLTVPNCTVLHLCIIFPFCD